jgi:hypothetical protein
MASSKFLPSKNKLEDSKIMLEDSKIKLMGIEAEQKEFELFDRKSRMGMAATFIGKEGITYQNQFFLEHSHMLQPIQIVMINTNGEAGEEQNPQQEYVEEEEEDPQDKENS